MLPGVPRTPLAAMASTGPADLAGGRWGTPLPQPRVAGIGSAHDCTLNLALVLAVCLRLHQLLVCAWQVLGSALGAGEGGA